MQVSDKLLYNIGHNLFLSLARSLFKLEIIGQDNIPKREGILLMSNHLSYLDPPLVGISAGRELHFMAKEGLFKNRLFGAILREVNAFPVKRGKPDRAALKKALSLVKEDQALLVFPEGTRGTGNKLGKPQTGAGFIAYWANCPVFPVYVKGSGIALPRNADKLRLTKLIVTFGKPINMDKFKNVSTKRREVYPLIAQEIIRKIALLKKKIDAQLDT